MGLDRSGSERVTSRYGTYKFCVSATPSEHMKRNYGERKLTTASKGAKHLIGKCDSLVQHGFNLTLRKVKIDTSYAFVGLVPEIVHHGTKHIPYRPTSSVLSGSKARFSAILFFSPCVIGSRYVYTTRCIPSLFQPLSRPPRSSVAFPPGLSTKSKERLAGSSQHQFRFLSIWNRGGRPYQIPRHWNHLLEIDHFLVQPRAEEQQDKQARWLKLC